MFDLWEWIEQKIARSSKFGLAISAGAVHSNETSYSSKQHEVCYEQ